MPTPWTSLLPVDPLPWLLASEEPWTRWFTRVHLADSPVDDTEVRVARAATLSHPAVRDLVDGLPGWEAENPVSGHNAPGWVPNRLLLLHQLGIRAGDFARIDDTLEVMRRHQDPEGRLQAFGRWRNAALPAWGALPCDSHALADVQVRFGFHDDPRVRRAVACLEADLGATAQGPGWCCRPDPAIPFRGPGRKGDVCPQVTLEALRVFGGLPAAQRPTSVVEAARTALRAWRMRGTEKPYMFGHGSAFKAGKWPRTWYDAAAILEAVAPFPEVWAPPGARPEDTQAVVELAACVVAFAFGADGRVTPRSCFKGFEGWSFGQKKVPSPFATAVLGAALRPYVPLADEIRRVDVHRLPSSKGGAGVARAPER